MRLWIKSLFALSLSVAAFSLAAVSAPRAVAQDATSQKPLRAELELGYTYVRSNAPPGGCTCFNLNGGNATFAWPLGHGGFSAVGDVSVERAGSVGAGSIGEGGDSLTLSTFTAGARYTPRFRHAPLRPFGQMLVGGAHGSGTLAGGGAFAANLGGGVDLRVGRRFALRLAEVDYLVTTFDNGSNNHQNNLRVSTGVVIRF